MTAETEAELREQIKNITAERDQIRANYIELQIKQLQDDVADHEKRIRPLEDGQVKANTIYALFAGNGILSIIALFKLFIIP